MKKLIITIMSVMLTFSLICQPVHADTTTFTIDVTYGQTEARSMLSMINDFRQSDDTWYWNTDNTTKTTVKNLSNLTYDYHLEKVAMQRAVEIAVNFDHTRPDGTSCFNAYGSTYYYSAQGENIAAGQRNATVAFVSWREDDKKYDGQGHRRNMLNSNFTCVGIGHVYYNGYHFWVQEFGNANSGLAATTANDKTTTAQFTALNDNFVTSVVCQTKEITIPMGTSMDLPMANGCVTFADSWPEVYKPVVCTPVWNVLDESVIKIQDNKIIPLKKGTTTIQVSALGKTISIPVTVIVIVSINDMDIHQEYTSIPYDGTEKKPIITIDGLTEGTDFIVKYPYYCTNIGTKTLTIEGIGNCIGEVSKEYTITQANLPECVVEYTEAIYDGTVKRPKVTLEGLKEYEDYSISHSSDFVNVGTKELIIEGRGNYMGKVTYHITIKPAQLPKNATLSFTETPYTGTVKKPTVAIEGVTSGNDFSVSYPSDCVSAGTKTITITGIKNYVGTFTKTYTITPKQLPDCCFSDIDPVYTGKEKKPTIVSPILIDGKDCRVSYSNNTDAGTATITVTGINNYSGTKKYTFNITKAPAYSITAKAYSGTYDGSKHAITLSGIKSGSTIYYRTSSTGTWSKTKPTRTAVGKTTVYYKITNKNYQNITGSKTITIKPKGTTLSTLTALSKGFKATWKKQATQTKGYQLRYSTSSSMSNAKTTALITSNTTLSKKVTKLTAKKKYYVQVRTYKTVSGTKYYSGWSAKKYVTTK